MEVTQEISVYDADTCKSMGFYSVSSLNSPLYSLEENIQLKNEIEGNEANTHDGVKNLLRKYERYRVSGSLCENDHSHYIKQSCIKHSLWNKLVSDEAITYAAVNQCKSQSDKSRYLLNIKII